MTNIIINADDFGYSDGVCRSILELLEAHAITGTSLMCAALDASARMRQWGVSGLLGVAGVHLQLTGGRPLSPASEVPTLIDGSGDFRDPRNGDIPDVGEVEIEWRRQISVAGDLLGGSPTHLDSHHGMHRIEPFFEVYTRLAAELGVPVRGAGGDLGKRMRDDHIPGSVALVRDWTGKSLGASSLRQMVAEVIDQYPEEDAVEVIAHPGYNDEYLMRHSSLAAAREYDHTGLLELARSGWPVDEGHELAPHSVLLDSAAR